MFRFLTQSMWLHVSANYKQSSALTVIKEQYATYTINYIVVQIETELIFLLKKHNILGTVRVAVCLFGSFISTMC